MFIGAKKPSHQYPNLTVDGRNTIGSLHKTTVEERTRKKSSNLKNCSKSTSLSGSKNMTGILQRLLRFSQCCLLISYLKAGKPLVIVHRNSLKQSSK